VKSSAQVAVVATFTALVVGSDLALSGPEFSNIKLLDTLVFVSAYLFGLKVGAAVGVLSESIWSFVSPVGSAGVVAPFLILGELLFAIAGYGAARVWKGGDSSYPNPFFIGALLALCAFMWDFETNAATALIAFWPGVTLSNFLATEFNPFTLAFALAHEGSDFVFGALLAPTFIVLITKAHRSHV
jgi:uncharacterized membrane protein